MSLEVPKSTVIDRTGLKPSRVISRQGLGDVSKFIWPATYWMVGYRKNIFACKKDQLDASPKLV